MIEAGLVAIKAGVAVSGPAIGFVTQQLEDGEREEIRASFVRALEWGRASEEKRSLRARVGGAG